MFILYANKTRLTLRQREPVTSGSINVYPVRFEFSEDWAGLSRTAIFRAGAESRAVLLGEDNETVLPWEVLRKPGLELFCGVYGTREGHTVLPTTWAALSWIAEGASPRGPAQPPTPELWEQELAGKGDALAYDGLNLSLMNGDKPLSTVQIVSGDEVVTVPGSSGPLGSGADLIAGAGLFRDGDTLNVDNPVHGIYTLKEWNALSAEQKAHGTYILNDGEPGAFDWDTYSTEEQRIGTWIDGKPLYRKVVIVDYGVDANGFLIAEDVDTLAFAAGMARRDSDRRMIGLPNFISASNGVSFTSTSDNKLYLTEAGYGDYWIIMSVKYTKTTDPEVSE